MRLPLAGTGPSPGCAQDDGSPKDQADYENDDERLSSVDEDGRQAVPLEDQEEAMGGVRKAKHKTRMRMVPSHSR